MLRLLAIHAVAVVGHGDLFDPAEVVVLAGHGDVVRVFVEGVPDEFGQASGGLFDVPLQNGLTCLDLDRGHGYIVSRGSDGDVLVAAKRNFVSPALA